MVVLDTCALIELCLPEPKLAQTTLKAIEKNAVISSISFAELHLKVAKGKLKMNITPKQLFNAYKAIGSVSIADISTEQWFGAIDLKWTNQDPADRLITYLAKSMKAQIVTTDLRIKRFYKKVIW